MFFDGVTYASVSRNLAQGVGTFWAPHYTQTLYPIFYEHPPLGFFLESLFFRMLGESFWVERFASLVFGLAGFFFLALVWRKLRVVGYVESSSAWPCLIFACFPMTSWMMRSNMLEGIASVFNGAAVLAIVSAVSSKIFERKMFSQIFFGAVSGLCVAAAVLVKGPPQLFPLALPALLFLFSSKFNAVDFRKRDCTAVFITVFVTAVGVLFSVFFFSVSAREFLNVYVEKQLLASLSGHREIAQGGRISLVFRFFNEAVLPVALIGFLWLCLRRPKNIFRFDPSVSLWLAFALCASVPLLASPKQMGFYLYSSLPYFALSLAIFSDSLGAILEKILSRPLPYKSVMSVCGFCVATASFFLVKNFNVPFRDKEFFADLGAFGEVGARESKSVTRVLPGVTLPNRTVFRACPSDLASDWELVANVQRFLKASLATQAAFPLHHASRDKILWFKQIGRECEDLGRACQSLFPSSPQKFQILECASF